MEEGTTKYLVMEEEEKEQQNTNEDGISTYETVCDKLNSLI